MNAESHVDISQGAAKHIPDIEYYCDHFLLAAKEASIEERYRIMLLPSTAAWWDEKGDLMRDKLVGAAIEPREWWEYRKGWWRRSEKESTGNSVEGKEGCCGCATAKR